MQRSNVRFLIAVLTAVTIFGASASVTAAGNDRVTSIDAFDFKLPTAQSLSILAPDLQVISYSFYNALANQVTVLVKNAGQITAWPTKLHLTVTKINGMSVNRTSHSNLFSIGPNAEYTMIVATGFALPVGVAIEDTTFRIDVDPTDQVSESNETNNTVWHNL